MTNTADFVDFPKEREHVQCKRTDFVSGQVKFQNSYNQKLEGPSQREILLSGPREI